MENWTQQSQRRFEDNYKNVESRESEGEEEAPKQVSKEAPEEKNCRKKPNSAVSRRPPPQEAEQRSEQATTFFGHFRLFKWLLIRFF